MANLNIKGFDIEIDEEDRERILSLTWHRVKGKSFDRGCIYFRHSHSRKQGTRQIWLHRFISMCPDGLFVDHKNGNTLDNRKENLRFCTPMENCRNTKMTKRNKTGYKGVSFVKSKGKFVAYISIGGKNKGLGHFDDPKKAHEAYCEAAKKYHGEFARTE